MSFLALEVLFTVSVNSSDLKRKRFIAVACRVVRPVSMYHDQDFCMEDCTKKHRFSIVRIIGHNSTGPTNLESNEEIDASVELQTDLADDCRIKTYKGFLTLPEFQLAEAWALLQSKAE